LIDNRLKRRLQRWFITIANSSGEIREAASESVKNSRLAGSYYGLNPFGWIHCGDCLWKKFTIILDRIFLGLILICRTEAFISREGIVHTNQQFAFEGTADQTGMLPEL